MYKFKRYEDASLSYTGIDTHKGTVMGLWDTAVDTATLDKRAADVAGVIEKDDVGIEGQNGLIAENPEVGAKDYLDVAVGDHVEHKSLGVGKVTSLSDGYIFVEFADRERKFQFPASFEKGYMALSDGV